MAAAALGAAAFILMTNAGTHIRAIDAVTSRIEQAVGTAGLTAQNVQITGNRFTAEADILAVLGLARVDATAMAPADLVLLRRRVEALPWVETAAVERVLPNGLSITVQERRPIAVWRRAAPQRLTLIDATGRELADINGGAPQLPLVAGEGAPAAAASLLAVLARHPELAAKLEVAERIGARRWSLRLAGLPLVLLPETGEAPALDDLTRILASHDADAIAVIDLRVRNRADLRPASPRRS